MTNPDATLSIGGHTMLKMDKIHGGRDNRFMALIKWSAAIKQVTGCGPDKVWVEVEPLYDA